MLRLTSVGQAEGPSTAPRLPRPGFRQNFSSLSLSSTATRGFGVWSCGLRWKPHQAGLPGPGISLKTDSYNSLYQESHRCGHEQGGGDRRAAWPLACTHSRCFRLSCKTMDRNTGLQLFSDGAISRGYLWQAYAIANRRGSFCFRMPSRAGRQLGHCTSSSPHPCLLASDCLYRTE